MKKFFLLISILPGILAAQELTDVQYEEAMKTIKAEASYHIYTMNDGEAEADTRYYLTDNGHLTPTLEDAGLFVFHKTEGYQLYKSPGWQFDQYFTNPGFRGGGDGEMISYGYIRQDAGNHRIDYEGQVWYKHGDLYAVRATNATNPSWGSGTFWGVVPNYFEATEVPNAEYVLVPQFTWHLELVADEPEQPEDPSVKEVQRLTNLPHVYINTFTGRGITSKTDYVYARMWYVDENDEIAFYDSLQIRGRGNSTWNMAKKPYKLKFSKKAKLLGKGYANTKKWTMLANHGDKTLIRNAVTSLMGERVGLKFNPAAKFVDLTLNDAYVGNYQISDQMDVRPHRVNIQEQDYPLAETSDITGGYLLEADGFADFHSYSYWSNDLQGYLPPDGFYTSRSNVPVRIHYPDAGELDWQQTDYIRDFLAQFEEHLFADHFDDADEGYRAYVDSASLANWYLCTEMSGNVDGMYSTYFYKEQQDNRLFWGPLWDYDIAYNNDNRSDRLGTSNTERQLMKDASYGAVKSWVQQMWKDPWFARLINRRYHQLIQGGMEDYLYEKIDSLTNLLDASIQLNYQRWGIDTRNLRERVLYSTYDEYISDLRTYINRHLAYLSEAFAAYLPEGTKLEDLDPKPIVPDFPADTLRYYAISNAGSGTYLTASMLDDASVFASAPDDACELSGAQQWRIFPLSNGYLYIVNRATGRALNDPTGGEPTATTLVGAQLNTVSGDSLDIRQQWNLVAQSDERYNLVSRFSQHAANLSGGSGADGTPVLSYTSDSRDASSNNRLWRLSDVGQVEEPTSDDVDWATTDFALAYEPHSGRLHFGTDDRDALGFVVRVYDHGGRCVTTFRAAEGTNLAHLSRGLYLVTWTIGGRQRTVKLIR